MRSGKVGGMVPNKGTLAHLALGLVGFGRIWWGIAFVQAAARDVKPKRPEEQRA